MPHSLGALVEDLLKEPCQIHPFLQRVLYESSTGILAQVCWVVELGEWAACCSQAGAVCVCMRVCAEPCQLIPLYAKLIVEVDLDS